MKPTDKELRELDCWIADNIFGLPVTWRDVKAKHPQYFWFRQHPDCKGRGCGGCMNTGNECEKVANYTTDPAAAMEVLEKCAEKIKPVAICIEKSDNGWVCYSEFMTKADDDGATESTLPLTIALFAKQLFSK